MDATEPERQLHLFEQEENPRYLTEQLITYIGNKRSLLSFIGRAVAEVCRRLERDRIHTVDLFSGSGVVARYLKRWSSRLVANDLEPYSELINRCYLTNRSEVDPATIRSAYDGLVRRLQEDALEAGIITRNYAPRDDARIRPGERVFYTNRNARYLDTARQLIDTVPTPLRRFFLAPLLSEASIHANTSGVFKGFYKDASGVGRFGGTGEDALVRIKGPIALPFPVFSNFETQVEVYRADANALVGELDEADLMYVDPPYNQHPYGSNYFMLNLILSNTEPEAASRVSGIPKDWRRSAYNSRSRALEAFEDLVRRAPARFLLVSFNSEGFIDRETMLGLLSALGEVEMMQTRYNTFRGSRNLRARSAHVHEYLFLVERR
jgi:adenine-specific DNA-methyltransferase